MELYTQQANRKISDFSVLISFIVLTIVGFAFIPLLNISLKPENKLPEVTVEYWWPGASAKVIETEVTSKLERLLNNVSGVKEISSISKKEVGYITISFNKEADIDISKFEISTIIRRTFPHLPQGVSYPVIYHGRSGKDSPLLHYTVSSSANTHYIAEYAQKKIVPALSSLKDIKKVDVYGYTPYIFKIAYSPESLEVYGLHIYEVISSIREYLDEYSLGKIETNSKSEYFSTVLLRTYSNDIEWKNIPITKQGNRIIYLSDIAQIKYTEGEPVNYHRINGYNNINIVVYAEQGANSISLSKKIKNRVKETEKNLPTGYFIKLEHDDSEYIIKELQKISFRTVCTIIILLLFVLIITRRVKYLLLIFLGLIVNLSLAAFLFYVFKVDIHLYSLAGITISLGIVIDNNIVMIEHYRLKYNKKVFLSILAATLTTIGSVSVIFLLNEEQIVNLRDFVWVVIITLTVSIFVAYLFIPSWINKHNILPKKNRWFYKRKRIVLKFNKGYSIYISFSKRIKIVYIIILILGFGIPVHLLPDEIDKKSKWCNLYSKTLGSEAFVQNIKEPLSVFIGGSMRLFTEYVFDSYGFSDPQQTKLYVIGSMPEGCTVHQLNDAIKNIEAYLATFPEIENFITTVGTYKYGAIEITFKEKDESSFPYILKGKLISMAIGLGGVDWSVFGVGRGFSNAIGDGFKPYRIILEGYNYDILYKYAEQLQNKLLENKRIKDIEIAGIIDWSNTKSITEYYLNIDKKKLAAQSISYSDLYVSLKNRLSDNQIGSVVYNEKYTNILVEPDNYSNFNIWWLKNNPWVINETTSKILDYSILNKTKSGIDIYKYNQQYRLNVAWDFIGPHALAEKEKEKELEAFKKILPMGFKAYESKWYTWDKKDKKQYLLILVILVVILIICSIAFESIKLSLSVLALVPISFIGVFITFYIFDIGFDQGGFASFILLTGLAVNSAIYIISDYIDIQHTKANMSKYIKSFNKKAIPIFLTILSTMLGMLPFIWSGQNEVFWFSFAVGTIGGLLFSIVGLFIYLPLFINFNK